MKHISKKILKLVLVFTLVFSMITNSSNLELFKFITSEIATSAKNTGQDYKQIGRPDAYGGFAIPSLWHGSKTAMRRFKLETISGGTHRVFCGYSLGISHVGDAYRGYIYDAQVFVKQKKTQICSSRGKGYGYNPAEIAKALWWYYNLKKAEKNKFNEIITQAYIWASSMPINKNGEKNVNDRTYRACKEVGETMKGKSAADGIAAWRQIHNTSTSDIQGKIEVYDFYSNNKKCVSNSGGVHQPYFRIVGEDIEYDYVKAKVKVKLEKPIEIEVKKIDEETGTAVPLKNTDIEITTNKDINGQTTFTGKTNDQGIFKLKTEREYEVERTKKKKYCKNYDSLFKENQHKVNQKGIFKNKKLAMAAAEAEAREKALDAIARKIKEAKAKWTVKEIKAPNHYIVNGTEKPDGTSVKTTKNTVVFVEDGITSTYLPKEKAEITVTTYGKKTTTKKTKVDGAYLYKASVTFSNKPKTGSIVVNKKASDNAYSSVYDLNGAVYSVTTNQKIKYKGKTYNANTKIADITISNGKATIKDLPVGTYKIQEIKAPAGFELETNTDGTPKIHTVTLAEANNASATEKTVESKSVNSVEQPKKGSVTFVKWIGDEGNGYEVEPGAQFTITGQEPMKNGQVFSATQTAGADGRVTFPANSIPYGNYVMKQISGNEQAIWLPDKYFTIGDDNPAKGIKRNYTENDAPFKKGETIDYLPTGLMIHKVTIEPTSGYKNEDEKRPLKQEAEIGATFEFFNEDTNETFSLTTDENGIAKKDNISEGHYRVTQTAGRPGYLPQDEFLITIPENPTKENLTYELKDSWNGEMVSIEKKYTDYDYKGEKQDEGPEEGAEFYILKNQFTADELDAFSKMETSEERKQFVQNHIDLLVPVKNGFSNPMITETNGKAEAQFADNYHSDENGFVLLQTAGKEGYDLAKPILSTSDAMEKEEVDGTTYYHTKNTIDNPSPVKFSVAKIVKTKTADAEGTKRPEQGAKFKVYDQTGQEFSYTIDGRTINTFETNENGVAYVPFLYLGDFTVEQIEGSETHKLAQSFEIEVFDMMMKQDEMEQFIRSGFSEDTLSNEMKEKLQKLTYEKNNEPLPVWLQVMKKTKDTQIPLNDAYFDIYKQNPETNEWEFLNQIKTGESRLNPDASDEEKKGKADFRLDEYGHYKILEYAAPFGYKRMTDEIEFTVDADHAKEIEGTVWYYDNEQKGFTFENPLVRGPIRITKNGEVFTGYDQSANVITSETKNIDGAVYKLYAEEDIYNDDGTIVFHKDQEIDMKTTGANGNPGIAEFTFSDPKTHEETNQFFMGKYYIVEVQAPKGFALVPDPIHVVLDCDATPNKINNQSQVHDEDEEPEDDVSAITESYFLEEGPDLNAKIKSMEKVIFTHIPKGANAVDVSAAKNGTLWGWAEGTTYYITSERVNQDIYFNRDCSKMFKNCLNLKEIVFNNIETKYMMIASEMFMNCPQLKELDIMNFNTSNLATSTEMFKNSPALEKIYIGNLVDNGDKGDESEVLGVHVVPNPEFEPHHYYNPETSTFPSEEIAQLTTEDFIFTAYTPEFPGEELTVTDDDIASISPEFPFFPNSDQKTGILDVTITLKEESEAGQIQIAHGLPLELHTQIHVAEELNPKEMLPETNENPSADESQKEPEEAFSISLKKVGPGNINSVKTDDSINTDPDAPIEYKECEIAVYAATNIVNDQGEIMFEKDALVDSRKTLNATSEDDGGATGTMVLPAGAYAQDPNAQYLYYVIEKTPPIGLDLPAEDKRPVIWIPNLDYTDNNLLSNPAQIENQIKITPNSIPEGNEVKVTFDPSTDYNHTFNIIFKNPASEGEIRKVWKTPKQEYLPDSITIKATKKNGSGTPLMIELKKSEGWVSQWDTANGNMADYNFEEINIDSHIIHEGISTVGVENSYSVICNNTVDEINQKCKKVWNDDNNIDGIRPFSIKVELLRNGESFGHVYTLNDGNEWEVSVNGLKAYDEENRPYTYEWVEKAAVPLSTYPFPCEDSRNYYALTKTEVTHPEAYTELTTFTNTHQSVTTADVQKTWEDGGENDTARPNTIEVQLYRDTIGDDEELVNNFKAVKTIDGETQEVEVTDGKLILDKNCDWKATAIDLKKINSEYNMPYQYYWREIVTEDMQNYYDEPSYNDTMITE